MSVNTSVLTNIAKTVTSITVRGYGDGVAAHVTSDWSGHAPVKVHSTPYLDAVANTVSTSTLRVVATTDNNGTPQDEALAIPINATGSEAISGFPPIIVRNPDSFNIAGYALDQGIKIQFFVTAISATPMTFQWQKTDINIIGATSGQYIIPKLSAEDVGRYRCLVANSSGSVYSLDGTLAIDMPNTTPSGDSSFFDLGFWPF